MISRTAFKEAESHGGTIWGTIWLVAKKRGSIHFERMLLWSPLGSASDGEGAHASNSWTATTSRCPARGSRSISLASIRSRRLDSPAGSSCARCPSGWVKGISVNLIVSALQLVNREQKTENAE